MKFNSKSFKSLLAKLSEDPVIKKAIDEAMSKHAKGSDFQAKSFVELVKFLITFGSKFAGKKKVELLNQYLDYVIFFISLCIILNKNIFENPEVRKFFIENWEGSKASFTKFYGICETYVLGVVGELGEKIKKGRKGKVKSVVE